MTEAKNTLLTLLEDAFHWDNAPIGIAVAKLGDLKRAYDHFAAIVLSRQSDKAPKLVCWVEANRKTGYDGHPIPQSIVAQCRKAITDGKWAFRDDGNYVTRHGVSIREPVVCCSPRCADMYMRYRNDVKAREKGAVTTTQSGMTL